MHALRIPNTGGLSQKSFFKYHTAIHDTIKGCLVPTYVLISKVEEFLTFLPMHVQCLYGEVVHHSRTDLTTVISRLLLLILFLLVALIHLEQVVLGSV